jgi:hypothetical protein
MPKKLLLLLVPVAILPIFLVMKNASHTAPDSYIVAGTGNPGLVNLYKLNNGTYEKLKSINTGYKFVHTVRIGDIYNNNKLQIIAGVSNSFLPNLMDARLSVTIFRALKKRL